MLALEMIVFMVNMPLVSQQSLQDWEMIVLKGEMIWNGDGKYS